MDFGIALTGVAAASLRASKQPRRWNLRTGAEAAERVATCGLAPCNHAGHSWAGIVPADTDALVELNGSLGAASEAVGSVSFPSSHRRLDSSHQISARRPGVAACSSCCQECCYCALCASSWSQRKPPTAGSSGGAAGARAGARQRHSRAEPEQPAAPRSGSAEQ